MPLPPAFHDVAAEVRNWGRWGDDDELGTLNLVTDEVVRRGVASVRTGRRISLAMPLSADGPQSGLIRGRTNPVHEMLAINRAITRDPDVYTYNDDHISMPLQAATHWDSLAHVSYGGHIYNGFPSTTVTETGASRCSIDRVRTLVSRGILLDVARARGVERLAPGTVVTGDDLDAAAELGRVTIEPGDVVLIRTGQTQVLAEQGPEAYGFPSPGPGVDAVRWFRRHDVAAVATDTLAFEVFPLEDENVFLPVHLLDLVDVGLTQGQNFVLEQLAVACAEAGSAAFLLSASPEPVVAGLGSPVNPVAVL